MPSDSPLITGQTAAERGQLGAHGRVDLVITELNDRSADERWIHGEGRLQLVARALLEARHERSALLLVERDGGRDLGVDDPRSPVDEIAVRARDVGQQRDAIALLEQ